MKRISIKFLKNGPIKLVNESDTLAKESIQFEDNLFDLKKCTFLCRCGRSKKQPFCEGSHADAKFDSKCQIAKNEQIQKIKTNHTDVFNNNENLKIHISKGSAIMVNNEVDIKINNLPKNIKSFSLCRCGNSKNKPFCDTTHNRTKGRYYTF
ncbi:hypothetical protein CPU12_13095 [Malaciobacter molluscorum LMG 25693]|uniref:CDGSH iron-sulfur domain-containing protein n=1 Tax=Malaciobacter molluscorum LMG 25693 TaxID=870501 RepID=A0A2G1DEJ3_9BACT|nr:CDGSH iron-sulfur domain-containing protein [Malaciobacter molluscorum]AXX91173.1 CDGSH iron-sulfur domain-containing protein [Malaciobacter molluscorum LMG 25693]PHO16911.1 hypothetical protein CPU12_13095 [Malaciobacter molluscorum LMG 25693]